MLDPNAQYAMDNLGTALVLDPRHQMLIDAGYEPREGRWWRNDAYVGGTRIALEHRDCLLNQVEDSIKFLTSEGYRVVSAKSVGGFADPRMLFRVALVVILAAVGIAVGVAVAVGVSRAN